EYSPGFSAVVHPPRTIAAARLPPIDAVILSHEHADHVNLPSLARLDRAVPVILPARAAGAVRDAIAALGFTVIDARAGDRFEIGALALRCFAGDPPAEAIDAELTNLQLAIEHADGRFFTYVDGWPSDATIAALGEIDVLVHADNVMDWSCLEGGRVIASAPPP